MLSQADDFLDAIFDAPDQDFPRLVYSYWLDECEYGGFAEFIRLQCQAAWCRPWGQRANTVWEKIGSVWPAVRDLFSFEADDWVVPNEDELGNIDAVHFHRGFLSQRVPVRFSQLTRDWSLWWPWFPTPKCALAPDNGWEEQAAECPTLRRIRSLRLSRWEYGENIWKFLASPHLSRLEELDLSASMIGTRGIRHLLESSSFDNVKRVYVRVANLAKFSGVYKRQTQYNPPAPGSLHALMCERFEEVIVYVGLER